MNANLHGFLKIRQESGDRIQVVKNSRKVIISLQVNRKEYRKMKEIKNTLLIFKARWPEAAVITGLFAISPILSILSRDVRNSNQTLSNTVIYLILALVFLLVGIVNMMLLYGFQRSVCLFETRRDSLVELLKYGTHFFWRLIGFGIIVVTAHFFLHEELIVTTTDLRMIEKSELSPFNV